MLLNQTLLNQFNCSRKHESLLKSLWKLLVTSDSVLISVKFDLIQLIF